MLVNLHNYKGEFGVVVQTQTMNHKTVGILKGTKKSEAECITNLFDHSIGSFGSLWSDCGSQLANNSEGENDFVQ